MIKALVVLIWPAGIAAILGCTALLARRSPRQGPTAPAHLNGHGGSHAALDTRATHASVIGLLLILAVGAVAVYALTALLGVLVVHGGPGIDKPIYYWTIHHRVHFWQSAMNRVTKVGDTWTTWGAAVAAAVCLAALYRKHRWLPPVALGAAIFIDHFLTLALRHTFERPGPPDSPLGTFPSGGCDRILVFYGLIAYLLWREVSGSRQAAIWSAGVIGALGFSEAYSRGYLTLHWFTDIASGLVYGGLVLVCFIATIRLVEGPVLRVSGPAPGHHPAAPGQHVPNLS